MDRHGGRNVVVSFWNMSSDREDMILWPVHTFVTKALGTRRAVDHAHATDDDLHARRRMQSLLTPPACQRPGPISGTPSLFHHPFHALTLPLGTAARVSVISKHLHP